MALEEVIVPNENKWGQSTAGEAMTRGMFIDVTDQTKATSATAAGRIGFAWVENINQDVSDSTVDTIANAADIVQWGPGSIAATDMYVEADSTAYTIGTLVEMSATAGKCQVQGGTPGTAIGVVHNTARPKNSSASKAMVVIRLFASA